MQIFAGVPLVAGVKHHYGDGYFWRFRWLCLRKLKRYGKQ